VSGIAKTDRKASTTLSQSLGETPHPGGASLEALGAFDAFTSSMAFSATARDFFGLHLVSLMYVGFRQIDGGIDLSKEHAEAEKLAMIM